jgi:hypothetical protein
MAKINNRTQAILENMIVGKFEDKRKALVEEIDATKNRDYEIIAENKERCKDSIVRVVEKAQNDITKLLKVAGLEIGSGCSDSSLHFVCLLTPYGEIRSDWKGYIKPIENKSGRLETLEQELKTLLTKCKKATDELILRASLGCKYNDVMEFINNLEV